MAKITFDIDDSLDNNFRRVVGKKYGSRKGVIGQALEEAIKDWIKKGGN